MLPLNEHQLNLLNKQRRDELLRQAEQRRLVDLASRRNAQPTPHAALVWLGGALVSLGERLQAEAERKPLWQNTTNR